MSYPDRSILQRDIEAINAGMARVQKEADTAAEIAQKEEGQKTTLVELFKTMQTELKAERERNEKLNTAAVANKQLAEEAAARIVKLEAEALSRCVPLTFAMTSFARAFMYCQNLKCIDMLSRSAGNAKQRGFRNTRRHKSSKRIPSKSKSVTIGWPISSQRSHKCRFHLTLGYGVIWL